jgi:hypothetical protein
VRVGIKIVPQNRGEYKMDFSIQRDFIVSLGFSRIF